MSVSFSGKIRRFRVGIDISGKAPQNGEVRPDRDSRDFGEERHCGETLAGAQRLEYRQLSTECSH
jgi:hypothetical protein